MRERSDVTAMLNSKRRQTMPAPGEDHRKAFDALATGGQNRTERMLRWFSYTHLKPDLQAISKPFGVLAADLCELVPAGPERTVALRKLLESKDAAVRAHIEGQPSQAPDVVSRKLPDQTITKQTDEQKQNDKDLL